MTLLHAAARRGNVDKARDLLQRRYEVDSTDDFSGMTPLMVAANSPYAGVEMLELLVKHGADPEATCDDLTRLTTPLVAAASAGDPEKVRFLLEQFVKPDRRSKHGHTALAKAAYSRSPHKLDVMRLLLDAGANPLKAPSDYKFENALLVSATDFEALALLRNYTSLDALKWSSLMEAIAFGGVDDVRREIAADANLNYEDATCRTAWQLALARGDVEKATLIYDLPVDLDGEGRHAPLFFAVQNDNPAMVAWLLEIGAEIEARTEHIGDTPLMSAAQKGTTECVKVLLAHGAAVNATAEFGETALIDAAIGGSPEIVHLLADAGAELDHIDDTGYSALKQATEENNEAVVAALLERGANLDADRLNETPLHVAVRWDHYEIAVRLLDAGADPNSETLSDGDLPLMAVKSDDMLTLLLERGAKLDLPNFDPLRYVTDPDLRKMFVEAGAKR